MSNETDSLELTISEQRLDLQGSNHSWKSFYNSGKNIAGNAHLFCESGPSLVNSLKCQVKLVRGTCCTQTDA